MISIFSKTRQSLLTEIGGVPHGVLLLHTIPVLAVAAIATLNIGAYWVGKDLTGPVTQSGEKQLALQLTAKCHELLILGSLSEILGTHLLRILLTSEEVVPLSSLTVAMQFKDLSYLWSKDFCSLCIAKYRGRQVLIPLIVISVMLGVTVGPSSATALIPRLDEWPTGEAVITLNGNSSSMWPSVLTATKPDSCSVASLGCIHPLAWNSIAANLFSFWGQKTLANATALPQQINVPSVYSVRNLDARPKGLNTGAPDVTVATVQHAVIADLINSFRFLTYPSMSSRCNRTWSQSICSYQDVSWQIEASVPAVLVSCEEVEPQSPKVFTGVGHNSAQSKICSNATNTIFDESQSTQFRWTTFVKGNSCDASIGVVLRTVVEEESMRTSDFACSIKAQWVNSIQSTSYTATKYLVHGLPAGFEEPGVLADGSQVQTVAIDAEWAQKTVDAVINDSGVLVFDHFFQLGEPGDAVTKVEAILAVLFAESMAHTGAGMIPLAVNSKDIFLKNVADLTWNGSRTEPSNGSNFFVRMTMTGYAYGLYTATGPSVSTLTSVILLMMYAAIATSHLVWLYVRRRPYVHDWREIRDVLALCLECSPVSGVHDLSNGMKQLEALKYQVIIKETKEVAIPPGS